MGNSPQKLELPSITKKKQEEWAEMTSIYNSSYAGLTTAVATIGAIVSMEERFPASVDRTKLTNMVNNLNKNINSLREELNTIYNRVETTKNLDMDLMDVNMECIQISSEYHNWSNRFTTLCSQPLSDIISYVEQ